MFPVAELKGIACTRAMQFVNGLESPVFRGGPVTRECYQQLVANWPCRQNGQKRVSATFWIRKSRKTVMRFEFRNSSG